MKKNKLSIYLLKPGIVNPDQYLNSPFSNENFINLENNIKVFKIQTPLNTPIWQKSFFENEIDGLSGTGSGAIAFVPVDIDGNMKYFLLSFGYGYSKIMTHACDERFAIRTALNMGDTSKIRSISSRTFSSSPKLSLSQLSILDSIDSFGIDIEQDMLSNIVLSSANEKFGKYIVGGTSLHLSSCTTIHEIKDLLRELYRYSLSNTYIEKGYAWIDNVRSVKDKNIISDLDGILVEKIRSSSKEDLDGIMVSPPELIDWEGLRGFSTSGTSDKSLTDEISILSYFKIIGNINDINQIKSKNIYLWFEGSSVATKTWSLYRCIEFEAKIDKQTYVLRNGQWYEICEAYYDDIDNWYENLQIENANDFPVYKKILNKDGKFCHSEKDYNIQCAQACGFDLMDRNLITLNSRQKIEACDLYSDKNLIHVKVFDGASGPISHLLAQSVVSAKLFFTSEDFRRKFNEKLSLFKLDESSITSPNRTDFSITLGIITNKEKLQLPFFSKVNLRNTLQELSSYLGIKNVKILKITGKW